ncbi:MAG: hypothetical protein ABSH17_04815 [Syntrophobacteraceae bacterium]|jgi:hypothetical protein
MDIKKVTYIITNRLEGLSLALPMFVVGLGFMVLGFTLFPGIGIVVGIFIWWIAWRFMLSSSRKNRYKEVLKGIREKQKTLLRSSRSKYEAPTPKPDVKNESGAKSTVASETQETTIANSDH